VVDSSTVFFNVDQVLRKQKSIKYFYIMSDNHTLGTAYMKVNDYFQIDASKSFIYCDKSIDKNKRRLDELRTDDPYFSYICFPR
jgi:hypothetical protein